ncbi:MAG: FecR domain-containing protein [Bacteroidia bacterium]|nr:FecR domain-containing protein [Bacteroidia bacterium]
MNEDFYLNLLSQKLSGELGQAESVQLEAWLSASDENRETARLVEKAWQGTGDLPLTATVDLDAEFARLQKRIEREKSASNTTPATPRVLNFRWLAAAAAVLVLVIGGYLIRPYLGGGEPLLIEHFAAGEELEIQLADHSDLHLQPGSKLWAPESFTGRERKVSMSGEIFFDISKDESKPFVIEAAGAEVRVLGTSFSVAASETEVQVRVLSGRVKLSARGRETELTAGEKGVFLRTENQILPKTALEANGLSWHTKKLTFDDTNLSQAMLEIEKLYHIHTKIEAKELNNCKLSSVFDHQEVNEVLEIIATVYGAEVEQVDDHNYILKGGSCQ